MLHDDDRVALIPQSLERGDKALVVALVQSDARFVEYVEHIHQACANLCGKAYALTLTAREAHAAAREREVVEPHIEQELQAAAYLLQYLCRYLTLALGYVVLYVIYPLLQLFEVHRCQFIDVFVGKAIVHGLAVEARASTLWTCGHRVERVGPLLSCRRGLALAQLGDVARQTLILGVEVVGLMYERSRYAYSLARTEDDVVYSLLWQVAHWSLYVLTIMFEHPLHLPEYHRVAIFSQWGQCSVVNREARVGYYLGGVDQVDVAQALTARTCTHGRVEREVVGRGVVIAYARSRTHERARIVFHFATLVGHHHQALTHLHGRCYAFLQAFRVFLPHRQAVYHHLDVVVLVAVNSHVGHHLAHFAVNPGMQVSLLHEAFKQFAIVTLTAAHHRRQEHDALAVVALHDEAEYLLLGVFHHAFASLVAIGIGGTCKEQTQVVVDFGHCTHGAPRVLVRSLLLDAYHRAQTRYLVNLGTAQSAKEVTHIGRESLDISALTLGKYRVESQARLAAAAQTRDDREAVARYAYVDILQVVDTGALYFNPLIHHSRANPSLC